MNGITALSMDVGEGSVTPRRFTPDITYFVSATVGTSGPNRAPGDVKPSWKWRTDMAASARIYDQ